MQKRKNKLISPDPYLDVKRRLGLLTQELKQGLSSQQILEEASEMMTYECDACILVQTPPDLVVLVDNTDELQWVIQRCHHHQINFVARGAGTGLSGGALSVEGGVIIALNKLDKILSIDTERRLAWVEVGVVNARLNEELKAYGLFYAPDPSSQVACTIGGNVAENAGGIHCFKHGVTTDHIVGLEMLLPDGEILNLSNETLHQNGPDLLRIIIGSEGTLGVVSKVCLRLSRLPERTLVFQASFSSLVEAGDCVSSMIQQGIPAAAIEFLDQPTVKAVNQAFHLGFSETAEALLLVELSGLWEEVSVHREQLLHLIQAFHPLHLKEATTPEEAKALWKARKGTVGAYGRIQPAFYVHDCVIPRSKLAEVLTGIASIGEQYDLMVANVFHAGDGNLHPNLLFNPNDEAMVKRVFSAGDEILQLCLELGGTLSGEHGIGIEKIKFMDRQFTDEDLEKMRWIKSEFDPSGLSNPGKLIPLKRTCGEAGIHEIAKKKPFVAFTPDGEEEGLWI